ncbi:MAG: Adenosine deaminase [Anaerocolumna sp.]|jgi:adenosine deaminase|nr:Adenosine deaminase [Anaerocolumna sp.]
MEFSQALESGNIDEIRKISKSDLHNHSARGGNLKYISHWAGAEIKPANYIFRDLHNMQEWYEQNVKCYCKGIEGYEVRIKAAFRQAKDDGVKRLQLSFGFGEEQPYGNLREFANRINAIHNEIAPEIDFIPEIAFGKDFYSDDVLEKAEEYFEYGFYKSLDINGTEGLQPIKEFKNLYRLAKSCGLKLRAHIGEFGSADSIMEAVETLELDEVNHGNQAVHNKQIMRWLADHKIILNLCPASNMKLGIVKDLKSHPIKQLYDAGIKVTINTDDMLIFDVGLSEMYYQFFNDHVFTTRELDEIRVNGL